MSFENKDSRYIPNSPHAHIQQFKGWNLSKVQQAISPGQSLSEAVGWAESIAVFVPVSAPDAAIVRDDSQSPRADGVIRGRRVRASVGLVAREVACRKFGWVGMKSMIRACYSKS